MSVKQESLKQCFLCFSRINDYEVIGSVVAYNFLIGCLACFQKAQGRENARLKKFNKYFPFFFGKQSGIISSCLSGAGTH